MASSVGAASAVGPVVGGVVGGVVGQLAGWRPLFVVTLVPMLLLIPFALRVLPGDTAEGERRGFDLAGGVLLGLGAGLFLFSVPRGQGGGFASFPSCDSFLCAALALGAFLAARREAGSGAMNPLHALDAPPFSDAFLAVAAMAAVALVAAPQPARGEEPEEAAAR